MLKINSTELDKLAKAYLDEMKEKIEDYLSIEETEPATEDTELRLPGKLIKKIRKHLNKDLLDGSPDDLARIISDLSLDFDLKTVKKYKLALKRIFSYDDYKWGAYKLAKALKVDSCCYCNRQYTFTLGTDKEKVSRPQFDHFFPKSRYPYLALSFYNLIPSCSVCNSGLKGDVDMTLEDNVHPYKEGFEDSHSFASLPSCYEDLMGLPSTGEQQLELYFRSFVNESKFEHRVRQNIHLFKLRELYSEHRDFVQELLRLRAISSGAYFKNLMEQYDGLFQSEEEFYRLVFGNYYATEDLLKRPLAKLRRDILEELGVVRPIDIK
ncbi:HNH endonuclease [Saprospira grandis]|uniref:HNH domain-containing protein n=1 Tax=Saprospira grandis (strain Lewin) TaxID=984262 RepID=H6LAN7_SAPGL|nr:hypothetical protein [Saprospira grandis]AFC25630.1 hypothetical protein SGRA_2902 [Saprospira grandis str. Lewin]